jgi:type IX secretion system PorP/SprF family membrane protein
VAYNNQWLGTGTTYYFSYDQFVKLVKGGVGIEYIQNQDDFLKTQKIGLVYSPKFMIADKFTIAPSVKIGIAQSSVDNTGLHFGSQYVGGVYDPVSAGELLNTTVSYLDVSSGILINTKKFHAGFALAHMNKPNTSLYNDATNPPLPYKITTQVGYVFQKNDSAKWSEYENALFQKQGIDNLLQLNFAVQYRLLVAGLSGNFLFNVHSNSYFSAMFGLRSKRIQLNYSYSFLNYIPSNNAVGQQEITLHYLFSFKRKTKEEATPVKPEDKSSNN